MALEPKHLKYPDVIWASVFGLGFLKPAPGTWGSLGALALWWFWLSNFSATVQLLICGLYFFTGWWCSALIQRRFKTEDASQIVADEVVGMWLALALLPKLWWVAALAFVLFRILDIAKPGPIGWLDREVKGGLGVMLDDLVAGLVVATVLYFSLLAAASAGWIPGVV